MPYALAFGGWLGRALGRIAARVAPSPRIERKLGLVTNNQKHSRLSGAPPLNVKDSNR